MKSRFSMAALVTLAMAGAGSAAICETAPAPGEGRAKRPSRPYAPKIPATDADHERLRLAAANRSRKAARQAKGMSTLTGKTIPQQDDEPTSEDVEVLLAEMKEERL